MSTKFRTVITTAGAAKLAAATAPGGRKVNITTMAVGDGGGKLPVPDAGQTGLIHEVWRHALNKISQDKRNSNYIIAELVIPPEVGGFWMRELGLYDDAGTLIAVANMAESYKPALAEGSGRSQTCRMVIIVSSVASVELTIDTTTVMATQDYVDDKIAEHEQSRRHPDASLTAKGFTQLSSATNSTSETLAATPKAVKAAYDLANGKYTAQDATTARKGLVQLSSATNSTSETLAATPKAVKAAYDLANGKYTAQDATTARKGLVQLSSATNSDSETLAATPKAVKAAYDLANGKYTAQDATTARKGLVQLSSVTNSDSETLAATPKAVKSAYDNAEKRLQKDQNGADIPGKDTFTKNIGACRAYSGALSTEAGNWTTAQFIDWLESQGAFNHPYWMCKCSWSYGNNKIITDTDCGTIHLAGCVIEVMGVKAAMTIRVTTPSTSSSGGTTSAQFTYINHGADYAPGWRRDYNTKNKQPAFALGKTGNTVANNKAVGWNWDSGAYCAQDGGASKMVLHFYTGEGSCPAMQFLVDYKNRGIFYRSARDGYGFEADWSEFYTTSRKPTPADILALALSGGSMSGSIKFINDAFLIWERNTDWAKIGFKNDSDADSDSYMWFETGDNGNEYFKWRIRSGSTTKDLMTLKSDALRVTGQVIPSNFSNFDSRYVRDIRLGGAATYKPANNGMTWTHQAPSGCVYTGIIVQDTGSNSADNIGGVYYRPVQKYINGTWYNVAQV
ncbi:phage tail protein [Escherichia coli]|uniref:Phage tail protein n=2 Tax=root TaxID=1 RepID=A0ABM8Y4Y9_9CAUD|nr:tail fiber protein [Escherichia coli]YP_010663825.1 tail fiber protein [Peduovirus P2]EFA5338856.1 phage tail protein [Escherichia coli]EFC4052921.1 phage tail protein [Escherichia coli]EFE0756182.1 phage tail protein [Escherichia coli]EFG0710984.1 phage tail protein [Escherichia coli]EFH7632378.1 phage tail protein [Escherichia coli]